MPHDPAVTLFEIVQAIERALAFTVDADEERFQTDETRRWAVFSQIVIIGEAAGRLPTDLTEKNPQVPWREIVGMRHRLVHGYDAVNWRRVWLTVRNDLPKLLADIQSLI